ncbi:MFS transporter [Kineococcus sp. SYSU DK003]|uniref:MFS transporter n=1 Tax=Kineococcus sp. SYSU DK003 TaxID=3383124 RepID=UPI003D7CA5A2
MEPLPTRTDQTAPQRPDHVLAPRRGGAASAPDHRLRTWTLVVVSLTQLLVVLDGTIVGVALPHAQAELGLTDSARQWVVTAYALAFGSLLLLGGRIADYAGRKRTFLVGLVGFGVASVLGGVAADGATLLAARAGQGAFAALMAPAALAILTVTFPSGRERNKAFALFGAVSGAGSAIGLLLGGVLTQYLDWRWCLLVNVPFVVVGVVAGLSLLRESRAEGDRRYDVPGALTVTAGFALLVHGLTLIENADGLGRAVTLVAAGLACLLAFVVIERRSPNPLLPLRILTDRVRAAALTVQALVGAVMMGAMLYLAFHLQLVLHLGPLQAGAGTLPITISLMATVPFSTKLLNEIGPRRQLVFGPLISAAGVVLLFTRISADGSYWTQVLPAIVVFGVGMGLTMVPLQNLALLGVAGHDAGAASAAATAANQLGGSIGLAVLTSVYVAAVEGRSVPTALVDGYAHVFAGAAALLVVAGLVALVVVPRATRLLGSDAAAPAVH